MIEEDSVLCPVLWFAQDEPALRQVAEAGYAVCVPQHKELCILAFIHLCLHWLGALGNLFNLFEP